MTPSEVAERFLIEAAIPLGETPERAWERCHEVCREFVAFAHSLGVEATIIGVWQMEGNLIITGHYVVWFPDYRQAVDWTARQFWPNAPHPWIMDEEVLAQTWSKVLFK